MDPNAGISGILAVFGLGAFGGLAVEILKWYKTRESENLPRYAKKFRYWFATLAMIVLGGALATLYGLEGRNPVAVVQLGASAPALLGAFLSGSENKSRDWRGKKRKENGGGDRSPSMRAFLTFRG